MSDNKPPLGWAEGEKLVKALIDVNGYDAAKAATWATFDIHAAKFRESPNGDNFYKLSMTMCAMQVIRNEVKR